MNLQEASFLTPSLVAPQNGYLSEVDAPYVRYIPAPSSSSGSTISGRSSASSSAHDFAVANAQGVQILTVSLPQYRAVCNICMEDFQSSQGEQTEPPERLRKLSCKHVFHENCITQVIAQSLRQYSFGCPTCRQSIRLQRDPQNGSSGLGHHPTPPFSESFPQPSPRRRATRRSPILPESSSEDSIVLPAVELRAERSSRPTLGPPLFRLSSTPPIRHGNASSESSRPRGRASPAPVSLPRFRRSSTPPIRHVNASSESSRPRGQALPVPFSLPQLSSSTTALRRSDQPHFCRLQNPFKPTIAPPRRPCIPEESAPHVQPDMMDQIAARLFPDTNATASTLECTVCDRPVVSPARPGEGEEAANSVSETDIVAFRQAPCGHVFHADCLEFLIPYCECQLLADDIECLTCAHPIPLRSQGVDPVRAMIYNPVIPVMRAFGNMIPRRRTPIRNLIWHDQRPGATTLPTNTPSTWFRELLMDYRLLAAFRHGTRLKRLKGLSSSQRFMFKIQSIFSGTPHFENYLQDMQDRGVITFTAGTIRGPEGLWGHYISVSSIQDLALHEDVVGQAIWGVQRTAQEAKDAAALKVIHQLRGGDRLLE